MSCSICFLCSRDHLPRGGTTHSELDPPTSIVYQNLLHRFAHRPFWWGHFLHGASLFKNDSILCQVVIKLASPVPGPAWAAASGICMSQARQNHRTVSQMKGFYFGGWSETVQPEVWQRTENFPGWAES